MRTLTITLVTAFVVLLALRLPAASRGFDREERGNSQVVVVGTIGCFPDGLNSVVLLIDAGLGVELGAIPSTDQRPLAVAKDQSEECSGLIPPLPRRFRIGFVRSAAVQSKQLSFSASSALDALTRSSRRLARWRGR